MTSLSNGLSIVVDLRDQFPPVRDQGSRNSCLACSTSDAHAHQQGQPPLAAEYLLYFAAQNMPGKTASAGLTFVATGLALAGNGQPRESVCPYELMDADGWLPPTVDKTWHADLENLDTGLSTQIVSSLSKGVPVILGVRLTSGFFTPQQDSYIIKGDGAVFGGHAVLAVGYGQDQDSNCFLLIRNSWGTGWGCNGHAWLSLDYLSHNLVGLATVSPKIKN